MTSIFNWLLHFSTFLFRGSLYSMFRKLTNVEMLNLKIGAETQDKMVGWRTGSRGVGVGEWGIGSGE